MTFEAILGDAGPVFLSDPRLSKAMWLDLPVVPLLSSPDLSLFPNLHLHPLPMLLWPLWQVHIQMASAASIAHILFVTWIP